jgi:hypothetical protein
VVREKRRVTRRFRVLQLQLSVEKSRRSLPALGGLPSVVERPVLGGPMVLLGPVAVGRQRGLVRRCLVRILSFWAAMLEMCRLARFGQAAFSLGSEVVCRWQMRGRRSLATLLRKRLLAGQVVVLERRFCRRKLQRRWWYLRAAGPDDGLRQSGLMRQDWLEHEVRGVIFYKRFSGTGSREQVSAISVTRATRTQCVRLCPTSRASFKLSVVVLGKALMRPLWRGYWPTLRAEGRIGGQRGWYRRCVCSVTT